jgi:N-acyl homoserine lactone hydrolase
MSTPKRLYLIQVATLPPYNAPIVCYLVQMNDGTNILIDSGLAPNTPLPPGAQPPIMGKYVTEQLADIGLKPADIQYVICTHFDPDHAGNHEYFPDAEFIVQRAHYDAAPNSMRSTISRPHWGDPALHYCFVDGDTELVPGVKLIETSGHVLGHQSVLVRLPETGAVLLAIDAVTLQANFTADREKGQMDEIDVEAVRASTRKLIDTAQRESAALVVFGHDGQQWSSLKKLPEFYT